MDLRIDWAVPGLKWRVITRVVVAGAVLIVLSLMEAEVWVRAYALPVYMIVESMLVDRIPLSSGRVSGVFRRRLVRARRISRSAGVWSQNFAPGIWRDYWSAGWEVPPPYFLGVSTLTRIYLMEMGPAMIVFAAILADLAPGRTILLAASLFACAPLFTRFMAWINDIPSWSTFCEAEF